MEELDIVVDLPVICTRGMIVFPNHEISLDVGRDFSLKAIEKGVNEFDENTDFEHVYHFGTLCKVKRRIKRDNHGTIKLTVEGQKRVEILNLDEKDGCLFAKTRYLEDIESEKTEEIALVRKVSEQMQSMNKNLQMFPREVFSNLSQGMSASALADTIGQYINVELQTKQKILAECDINKRLLLVLGSMEEEKVINELEEKIDKLNASDEVKDKLHKEVKRLKNLSKGSSEVNVERTYIENCLELPWNNMSEDNNDIINARKVLDNDHYGMKDIKDRIIEALAVRNITSNTDAPILCLAGPPGTGKTSIARSVAAALNKEYVRICLGGVKDEAEIRGHRKTYVGAMPGRIIEGLKKAGTANPLMLLDEIDKVSNDYKSDTASALLEVLDSEQNSHFTDHYIEMPVDLSKVLFIATANDLSTLSRPLLDRMEIIEVSGYSVNEKLHIAKEHLVGKQLRKNGLATSLLKISDSALKHIILGYTKESGVRELERQIAKICRKAVTKLYEAGVFNADGTRNKEVKVCIRITDKNLTDYLGNIKYKTDKAYKKPQVGIVRGLAWTSVGGETLEIEVNAMPGSDDLRLTGNMGDVMKESAMIAYSYVRAITESGKYKVDMKYFDEHMLHLHIPEGAVPKDGPSAGVTMTTAMLSAVTGIPVRPDVAMTGEVTLRGRVLAIGGLKEKLLAAKLAGMKKVLVPEENVSDVEELDAEITDGLELVYVKDMSEVLNNALVL